MSDLELAALRGEVATGWLSAAREAVVSFPVLVDNYIAHAVYNATWAARHAARALEQEASR